MNSGWGDESEQAYAVEGGMKLGWGGTKSGGIKLEQGY